MSEIRDWTDKSVPYYVGQRVVLCVFGFVEERERLALLERAVVLKDVADAPRGEQFQSRFHLVRGVAQNIGCDFGIGDGEKQEVRSWCIGLLPMRGLVKTWPTVWSVSSQDGRDMLAVLRCAEYRFHPSI
jgi:hypothetical protein